MLFIERDEDDNIVAIYSHQDDDETREEINQDDMVLQLNNQPLQWPHGYDS